MKTIYRYLIALLLILQGAGMTFAQGQQDSILEIKLDATKPDNVHPVFPNDSLNIADNLGIKDPFVIIDKKYLMITRNPGAPENNNVSISYPKIWDKIKDVSDSTKVAKSASTFKGNTFCEIQELPTQVRLTDSKTCKNLAFYTSKSTVASDGASDWTITYFHSESKKIGVQQKQAGLLSDTLLLFANDSIETVSFKSNQYCLIDSIFIDSVGIPVSSKDHFLEETTLKVKIQKPLTAGPHKLAYNVKKLEGGVLVPRVIDVKTVEVKEATTDTNNVWLIVGIVIAVLLAAGGYFGWKYYVKNKKKVQQQKEAIEKKINEKLNIDGIDDETKVKLNSLSDQTKTTNKARKLEEILKQVDEIQIEQIVEPEPDGPVDVPMLVSDPKDEKPKISRRSVLDDFIGVMKAEETNEPDPEIRKRLIELKEQLRLKGKVEGQKETITLITNRAVLKHPNLKSPIQTPTDLAKHLENLLAITKEEAKDQTLIDNLRNELREKGITITMLNEQVSSITADLNRLEKKLHSAQGDLATAQQKNKELSSQVDALQNHVIDINSLDNTQKQSILEEARDAIKAEYEQQLQAKQSEIDRVSGQASTYQNLMEKAQDELFKEQERHREDQAAAIVDKTDAIQATRIELEQAKEEACALIRNELEKAQTALADAEENHRAAITEAEEKHKAAIQLQKDQHQTSKLKWEEDKKNLEDTIASEKQGRIEDRKQADIDKTEAVKKAILDTERLAQEILDKEIAEHQRDNEHARTVMEQSQKDAATALAQLQEKMQSRIDLANHEAQDAIGVRQSERQLFAYEMQQHVVRMYQQLSTAFANAVANYQSEGADLVSKVEQMYNWYQANIVAPFQTEESLSLQQMVETMQQECVRQLKDRYSMAARLVRMVSYSQISTEWVEWMTHQGVDLQSLRIAYGELTGLLGRCKVTLITPSLFIDLYEQGTYQLGMGFSPIQNYCPDTFDCLAQTKIAVVRDLSTPGYLIDGNLEGVPVVMAQ